MTEQDFITALTTVIDEVIKPFIVEEIQRQLKEREVVTTGQPVRIGD